MLLEKKGMDLLEKDASSVATELNLNKVESRVCGVLDISASMRDLFKNGDVQEALKRLLAAGMQFDDDGAIDLYLFGKEAHYFGEVTADEIENTANEIRRKYPLEAGTNYAEPMKLLTSQMSAIPEQEWLVKENEGLLGKLFGGETDYKIDTDIDLKFKGDPVFVFFLTDGDNHDKDETIKLMKKYANYPVFWQFAGIGKANYSFLENLDEMEGRYIDNAGFFQINRGMSDKELFNSLLNEFPSWLQKAKTKQVL